MGFTLVAYNESQDTAGNLTLHAALADQHITVDGDDILVPGFASNILAVYGVGLNLTRMQISSPSLRKKNLLDISPVDQSAEPEEPSAVHFFNENPVVLTSAEALQVLMAEDGAGAQRSIAALWLMDTLDAKPSGEIRSIRATTTTATTANLWSLVTLTLDQQLEAGRYAIVGFRAVSATGILARLVIPGSAMRPGVIAYDAVNDTENVMFRMGKLGSWGEFEHTFIPQVEMLTTTGETPDEFILDVILL